MKSTLYKTDGIKVINFEYINNEEYKLDLNIYVQGGWSSSDKRPAIVFFFGGGWVNGTINHFKDQSLYFASRGLIAITPEYRIMSKYPVTPFECVADGKAALLWIRNNHEKLGIDKDKIIVGGGSAGGHVAACSAIITDVEIDQDEVYKIPKALVLFNPVVDTTENGYGYERIGQRARKISPVHNIRPGLPPTIIFHGTDDKIVPFENAIRFCNKMQEIGNKCMLIPFHGKGHAFFNYNRDNGESYKETIRKADEFLSDLGFLPRLP